MMRNGRTAAVVDWTDAGIQRQPSGLHPSLGRRKRVMSTQYLQGEVLLRGYHRGKGMNGSD